MKVLTKAQETALYYIELDGGLIRSVGSEYPFSTKTGRQIDAKTAKWLIDHHKLIAHQDGLFPGMEQSWEVAHKKMP